MNKKETCNGMPAYEGPLSKNQSLAQSELEFNPDWDAMAVMVEEQQRMAKRIEELTQLVTSQGIRLMDAEAQPEPEPVAYINVQDRKLEWAKLTKWETPTVVKMDKVPLYAAPQTYAPSENNLAYERGYIDGQQKQIELAVHKAVKRVSEREWHELTDREIATIKTKYEFGVNSHSFINAVRELETWLKERNT